MQPDSRKEKQPDESRKEVTQRKPRFRIVKLEERIAPGGNGKGNGSNLTCGNLCTGSHNTCNARCGS